MPPFRRTCFRSGRVFRFIVPKYSEQCWLISHDEMWSEMATSGAICTEADLVLPPLPAVFLKRKLSGKSKDATALVVTQWSKQGFEFVSSARRNSFAQICESDLYPVECATSNDDIWNALEHILVQ